MTKDHEGDEGNARKELQTGYAERGCVRSDVVRVRSERVRPVVDATAKVRSENSVEAMPENAGRRDSESGEGSRSVATTSDYIPPPPSALAPGRRARGGKRKRELPPPVRVSEAPAEESEAPAEESVREPRRSHSRGRMTSERNLPTLAQSSMGSRSRSAVPRSDARIEEGRRVLAERVRTSDIDALRTATASDLAIPETPMDNANRVVQELLECAPGAADHVVSRLEMLSVDVVMPLLTRRFPGVLWFDRKRPYQRLPMGRDVSAIAAAFVAFADDALPYLFDLLESDDDDIRYYAALVAEEIGSVGAVPLLARFLFDGNGDLRDIGAFALGVFRAGDGLETLFASLRGYVGDGSQTLATRQYAIEALIRLRDDGAVEDLILAMEDPQPTVQGLCRSGLRTLSGHDCGTSVAAWRSWFKKNEKQPRVEWLLDGLLDRKQSVRELAYRELNYHTGHELGVAPETRAAWKRVHGDYREWLARTV